MLKRLEGGHILFYNSFGLQISGTFIGVGPPIIKTRLRHEPHVGHMHQVPEQGELRNEQGHSHLEEMPAEVPASILGANRGSWFHSRNRLYLETTAETAGCPPLASFLDVFSPLESSGHSTPSILCGREGNHQLK